jgi:hypothetical protein
LNNAVATALDAIEKLNELRGRFPDTVAQLFIPQLACLSAITVKRTARINRRKFVQLTADVRKPRISSQLLVVQIKHGTHYSLGRRAHRLVPARSRKTLQAF